MPSFIKSVIDKITYYRALGDFLWLKDFFKGALRTSQSIRETIVIEVTHIRVTISIKTRIRLLRGREMGLQPVQGEKEAIRKHLQGDVPSYILENRRPGSQRKRRHSWHTEEQL